jgi:hypothetical protein
MASKTKIQNGEMSINENGNKEWRLNGLLHRIDGPAVEWENGSKEWWVKGERHRADGPAIFERDEYCDEEFYETEWWYHGKHLGYEDKGYTMLSNRLAKLKSGQSDALDATMEKIRHLLTDEPYSGW